MFLRVQGRGAVKLNSGMAAPGLAADRRHVDRRPLAAQLEAVQPRRRLMAQDRALAVGEDGRQLCRPLRSHPGRHQRIDAGVHANSRPRATARLIARF